MQRGWSPCMSGAHKSRHDQLSSLVQRGSARPTIVVAGSGPKYRPSKEYFDRQFMRNTSWSATIRQPRQAGRLRPRRSQSRAWPTAIPSTVIVRLDAADRLTGKGEDMLQDRNVQRQISALGEESSDGLPAADNYKSPM